MAYRGTTSLTPKWVREFKSFQEWVNKAPTWIDKDAVCIDAKGRRCLIGADFQRARDEDAFPVRFFWECEDHPVLAGIAAATAAGAQDAYALADRLMSRADNPPDPEVDVEELIRMLQTEDGRTAAFRMMQEDYQDRVDAANLLRAQKLHIDRVDAKLATLSAPPDGRKAVPEDATDEMVAAALKCDWSDEDERATVHNVWHAMYCAAPPAPPENDRLRKLLMRAGMLAGLVRHMRPGNPMTTEVVEPMVQDATHILRELAIMGVQHAGCSDAEVRALLTSVAEVEP